MLTRTARPFAQIEWRQGSGVNAGLSMASQAVARDPSFLRKGRWFGSFANRKAKLGFQMVSGYLRNSGGETEERVDELALPDYMDLLQRWLTVLVP